MTSRIASISIVVEPVSDLQIVSHGRVLGGQTVKVNVAYGTFGGSDVAVLLHQSPVHMQEQELCGFQLGGAAPVTSRQPYANGHSVNA